MSSRCAAKLDDKRDTKLGVPLDMGLQAFVAVIGGQNESYIFPYAGPLQIVPEDRR